MNKQRVYIKIIISLLLKELFDSVMNILFFARLFYPHIGGVEKHVLEISKILIKKGYKITVIAELHDPKLKLKDSIHGIEIYRIPVGQDDWFKKFRIWLWLWEHRKLIKEANIVHCHDVFFWYVPFRFLCPKKPIFTTFHGYEGNNLPTKKAIFMHKIAEKLSRGNICIGDYLKKWYGTKPDYVSYGGVNISKSQNSKLSPRFGEAGKTQNYNSNLKTPLRVAFIGRLEQETGIMEYLRAVKILKEKGYELHLNILGDGSQRKKAEKFCILNKLDVSFKGFVNNVVDYLVDADFVFTSRYLSTLESLFARKFVFSVYNNPIKKDCFQMSPFADFIVLVNNEANLVSKLIYYMNNKDLIYNKLQDGYRWVSKQTWEEMAKLYLKLWGYNEKNTNNQ